MKQIVIAGLIFLNAALAGALMLGLAARPANAQVYGGASDYVTTTAHIESNRDALYIIDLATQRMAAWELGKQSKKLEMIGRPKDLPRDFGTGN
jgi:hypothetical protein